MFLLKSAFAFLTAVICVEAYKNVSSSVNFTSEVPYIRDYFYAGGRYVPYETGGHVFEDQIYVERLNPVGGATKQTPLVLIHGNAQTGTVNVNHAPVKTAF